MKTVSTIAKEFAGIPKIKNVTSIYSPRIGKRNEVEYAIHSLCRDGTLYRRDNRKQLSKAVVLLGVGIHKYILVRVQYHARKLCTGDFICIQLCNGDFGAY